MAILVLVNESKERSLVLYMTHKHAMNEWMDEWKCQRERRVAHSQVTHFQA